jgi:phage terminase large subunit-like protein
MPFDESKADRAQRFFENVLVHTKGRWAGKKFKLADWQRDEIIRPLFGTVNEDGTRQYRRAYIECARKQGKSELAAGIALYLLLMDGEQGAEIYGAACDREQAGLVYQVASGMVKRVPELARVCKVVDSRKTITVESTGSFYRAIPADAAGAHGYNSHGIIFDELHAQPNRDLWDVLTTSTGARTQPLVFAITTAGFDRESLCWQEHEYARKVIDGVIDDPKYFARIWSTPEDADWTDEKVWRAANPALGDFRDIGEMRDMCLKAREMPSVENAFRRLYLSQWTQSETRYIPMEAWAASAGSVDFEALRGRDCYAGLDLATVNDVAALTLVFPPEGDSDAYKCLPFFWIPEENMHERVRRDRVPYDVWARQGFVTATPGNVIDYAFIRAKMNELADIFSIREVAFDRWGATKISTDLQEDGFTMVQFGQGFASMSAPTKELLRLVLDRRLHHGNHPVLRWMCDNLVVRMDPAGNVKPDKEKSTEKIDGMVALVMALDRATAHLPAQSWEILTF